MTLTVGSSCSGIGGWDLGLERAGMRVRWQVEIYPWCRRVLERHWPGVTRYADAFTVNNAEVEKVDVIAAGYRCQPFSVAGHLDGHDDPRNVWLAVRRAVRDVRPRGVLLENVTGHLAVGCGRVLGELAALGYDATWDCIPAAAFGARTSAIEFGLSHMTAELLPTPTAAEYGTSNNGCNAGRPSTGKGSLNTMARRGLLPTPTDLLPDFRTTSYLTSCLRISGADDEEEQVKRRAEGEDATRGGGDVGRSRREEARHLA